MITGAFLKDVEVFNVLDEQLLNSLQSHFTVVNYQKKDQIFEEEAQADFLWIVYEGRVDLRFDLPARSTSEENNISSVREKMIFGWSSMVPPHRYTLSAYCATQTCKVVKIHTDHLLELFEQNPQAGYLFMTRLIQLVGNRFQKLQETGLPIPAAKVKITVHMATCGIAAGARKVMDSLMEEAARSDHPDVEIVTAGCLGKCPTEPNVTVEVMGEKPVVYQKIDGDKMRQIFSDHVLKGKVVSDYVLS